MSARLHVDLNALASNIDRVRETVAPAELMLVVKDDAYGHGLEPVVHAATAAGVTWFGAFDVRTGAAVRTAAGGAARIFAWIAASRDDLDAAIATRIDLGIGDAGLLEELADAAADAGATPACIATASAPRTGPPSSHGPLSCRAPDSSTSSACGATSPRRPTPRTTTPAPSSRRRWLTPRPPASTRPSAI
jgi:hypothetical protein